jgi:hypothetical protein
MISGLRWGEAPAEPFHFSFHDFYFSFGLAFPLAINHQPSTKNHLQSPIFHLRLQPTPPFSMRRRETWCQKVPKGAGKPFL